VDLASFSKQLDDLRGRALSEVARADDPAELDAVESAYRDVADGRDRSPIRSRLPLGDGDLLLMPGLRDGGRGATVKIVTVMAANAARGLPTVQATVVWLDATTRRRAGAECVRGRGMPIARPPTRDRPR